MAAAMHLGFAVEAKEWSYRPERLFASNVHACVHIGQDRGLKEIAAEGVPLAADQDPRASFDRIGDMAFYFLKRLGIDERPDLGISAGPSDAQRGDGLDKLLGEDFIH